MQGTDGATLQEQGRGGHLTKTSGMLSRGGRHLSDHWEFV